MFYIIFNSVSVGFEQLVGQTSKLGKTCYLGTDSAEELAGIFDSICNYFNLCVCDD